MDALLKSVTIEPIIDVASVLIDFCGSKVISMPRQEEKKIERSKNYKSMY